MKIFFILAFIALNSSYCELSDINELKWKYIVREMTILKKNKKTLK